MVKRLWSLLAREVNGLHEAAFLLGTSAFLAQLLALGRDRLLASSFGAGRALDVYYAAFRLPDLIYVGLASFVSVTVLIPFVVQSLERRELSALRRRLDGLFTVFMAVMVAAAGSAFFLLPRLSPWIAPGFSAEDQLELVKLSRVILLSPILLGLSNLLGSVTQGLKKFFIYALSPVAYNLGIIFGIVFFYPVAGLAGLAWGVVLGAVAHLAVQLPILSRSGFLPRLVWPAEWRLIGEVVIVSLPRAMTLGAHQLLLTFLVALASTLAVGAVTVFNLAWNLQSVPLSIVGVSYSVAAFPTLTKLFAQGDLRAFRHKIETAFRHIVFWSLIATVFFIVLRAQVVRVILGAGAFGWTETRLTAAALALFAVSIAAQSLVLLFVRGYYAAGRTSLPFWFNTGSSLLIVVLAYYLHRWFEDWPTARFFFEELLRISDLSGTAVIVLPLAFSIGLLVNLALFVFAFYHHFGGLSRLTLRAVRQAFVAAVFGGFLTYQSLGLLALRLDLNTFSGIFTQGLMAGLIGLASTFGLLVIVGNQELKDLSAALTHKFWRSQPIAPEPEEL